MSSTANGHITGVQSKDLLSAIQSDSLYILLFYHPNLDIRYHWGFYDHLNSEQGGWKFDIINPGGVWRLAFAYGDGKPQSGILDPDAKEPLGAMIRVGSLKAEKRARIHELIRAEDDMLNELNAELSGEISCRVYVMRACERLKTAGFVTYGDWGDVEKEVLRTGDANESVKGKKVAILDSRIATVNSSQ